MGITDMFNKIKELIKTLFGFADTNKDGKIDVAELTAVVDKAEADVKVVKATVKEAVTVVKKISKSKAK
jgi:Ca2+-binding EF-hand superfamily protein